MQVPTLAKQMGNQVQEEYARYFLEAPALSKPNERSSPRIFHLVDQIAKTLGDLGKAHTLSMRGWIHLVLGQYHQARQYYLRALERVREEGDAQGTAFVLYQLGLIAALEDDLAGALAHYQESRSITEQIDSQTGLLLLCSSIGMLHMKQERFDLARPYLEQSVILALHSGNQRGIAGSLYWLGYAVANTGDPKRAEQLFEDSLAIFTQLGSPEAQKVRDVLSQLNGVMNRGDI